MATGVLLGGDSFSDGQVVNAARLNNLVNLGDVLAGLIDSKTDVAPVAGDHILYLHGTSPGTLFKAAVSELTASVTSVGLAMPSGQFTITGSPVTSTGTLTAAWKNVPVNNMFAGPAFGSAAAPTFRAITPRDTVVPTVAVAANTIDWSLGNVFYKVLIGGTNTFLLTNAVDGQMIKVILVQTVAGGATVAWNTVNKWRGEHAPVMTPTQQRADIFTFLYSAGFIWGYADQDYA